MNGGRPRHWLLSGDNGDVVTLLAAQGAVTREGMHAFAAWAAGDLAQADAVRAAEHDADHRRRDVAARLRTSFSTALRPEHLFELSLGLDKIINGAKNTVREAEAMSTAPDEHMNDMGLGLATGVDQLCDTLDRLAAHHGQHDHHDLATHRWVSAVQRDQQHLYDRAMTALLDSTDLRDVLARQELYRRFNRMTADLVAVAEYVDYATVALP